MGFRDFFKKQKKNEIIVNGKVIDLDEYYDQNWGLFKKVMDVGSLDYELIEHYARYYDGFKIYKSRINIIHENLLEYEIGLDIFNGVARFPIDFEDYVGKSDCIELIKSNIEKCEELVEKVIQEKLKEEKDKKQVQEQKKLTPESKKKVVSPVKVSDETVEYIKRLKDNLERVINIFNGVRNSKNQNSGSTVYHPRDELIEEIIAAENYIVTKGRVEYEELQRNLQIEEVTNTLGYPSRYVEVIYDILYMINHYERDEAFNPEDLDVLVSYCKMNALDFYNTVMEWIRKVGEQLGIANSKK